MGSHVQALLMAAEASGNVPVSDAYPTYVQLLLHANGSGTSALTLVDDSSYQRVVTKDDAGGSSSFNTSIKKWGSASFESTGRIWWRPDTAFNLGSADWTMEAWVYITATRTGGSAILSRRDGNISTTQGWVFGISGRDLKFRANINSVWSETKLDSTRTASNLIPLNTWSHVAISRVGSTMYMFIDGTQVDSQAVTGSVADTASALHVGSARSDSGEWSDAFKFDDLRFTVGVGRYSAAFTPPTGPFESPSSSPVSRAAAESTSADALWANVSLLMHLNGTNGSTTFTDVLDATSFTVAGNAQITTGDSKFGGACGIWDGTGDYIERASASGVLLGNADFCVETWFKPNMGTTFGKVVGIWYDTGGSGFSWKWSATQQRMTFYYSTTGGNFFLPLDVYGLQLDSATWYHVAITRSTTTVTLWINGDPVASGSVGTDTFKAVATTKKFEIGRDGAGNTNYLNAKLDEMRITKATRYTGRFNVPTGAFAETA